MAASKPVAIEVRQGDTVRLRFTTTDRLSATPLDLSGASVEFSTAATPGRSPSWTHTSDDVGGRIDLSDAASGVVAVTILPDDSRAWGALATVSFELTAEWDPGTRLTLAWGRLVIEPETANYVP